jgi:hypothetical protein
MEKNEMGKYCNLKFFVIYASYILLNVEKIRIKDGTKKIKSGEENSDKCEIRTVKQAFIT